jgi:hypothetical protein
MMDDEQAMETPLEELMNSDLEHYQKAATTMKEWHSGIPDAIRFYHTEKPILEEEVISLRKGKWLGKFLLSEEENARLKKENERL